MALENNADLRHFLQPNHRLTQKTLEAKYRRFFKLGKIPDHVLNPPSFTPTFRLKDESLDGTVFTMIIDDPKIRGLDPSSFFELIKPTTVELLNTNRGYKVFTTLKCRMIRPDPQDGGKAVDEATRFILRR